MLSNEIPRSAVLDDGSKAFWPQRSSPSPSQRRQLDKFNYSDRTMEDSLIGGVGHRQVLDPLGSAPSDYPAASSFTRFMLLVTSAHPGDECMACRKHSIDADGKSHTPAPHTRGVTEMEALGRANLAKDGKKRKYEHSPARSMPESE